MFTLVIVRMYIGYKYWTFISQELPAICRRFFPMMSDRR